MGTFHVGCKVENIVDRTKSATLSFKAQGEASTSDIDREHLQERAARL